MSPRYILAGDFNAPNMAWGSINCDFKGNLTYFISTSLNVCIINTGFATRINRPPFNDSVFLSCSSASIPILVTIAYFRKFPW